MKGADIEFSDVKQYLPTVTLDSSQKPARTRFWPQALTRRLRSAVAGTEARRLEDTVGSFIFAAKLSLNVARPGGASDYSKDIYTYDDFPNDENLAHFSIAHDETAALPILRPRDKSTRISFILIPMAALRAG